MGETLLNHWVEVHMYVVVGIRYVELIWLCASTRYESSVYFSHNNCGIVMFL